MKESNGWYFDPPQEVTVREFDIVKIDTSTGLQQGSEKSGQGGNDSADEDQMDIWEKAVEYISI